MRCLGETRKLLVILHVYAGCQGCVLNQSSMVSETLAKGL